MKQVVISLSVLLMSINAFAFNPEIKTFSLDDGEVIEGRLCLPYNEVKTIVFYVPGTGPSTYLTQRPTFNFHDELANGFCEQGLAFFTYNRRGCRNGKTSPLFTDVDSLKYAQYTPLQEAEDVEAMIVSLRKDERFKNSKVILYGMSEGSIIASVVAERNKVPVDALLLQGYAHDNMFDIIKWQDEGHGVMIIANSIFDKDNDKRISREEYENIDESKIAQKAYLFQDMPFDSLDVVKDGFIDMEDIRKMRAPFHDYLMKCIMEDNYKWISNYYVNVTSQWFKSHFGLEPNKTRLIRVNIPIHIFHGTDDANTPVENVYDLQVRFNVCNKTNLTIHVFDRHNHDLNFLDWIANKQWSEGFKTVFQVAKSI